MVDGQEQRQPSYRMLISSEADLEDLVPGDRVKVCYDHRIKQMVYQKMEHGEGYKNLNPSSKAFFIEIPDGYEGEVDAKFFLWEIYVRYLQFGDGTIFFNSFHKNLTPVGNKSEQHVELKTLADMLVK